MVVLPWHIPSKGYGQEEEMSDGTLKRGMSQVLIILCQLIRYKTAEHVQVLSSKPCEILRDFISLNQLGHQKPDSDQLAVMVAEVYHHQPCFCSRRRS